MIYILGEAPGKEEDSKGIPFVGPAGRLLRSNIPDEWLPKIRWNNVIRCRPPGNRDPEDIEVECCRPSIIQDIEATRPRCIFGFGNFPLHWAIKQNGITKWNGRHVPVRIGNYTCWFFPILHPSYILHLQSNQQRIAQDMEFVFQNDLRSAFKIVDQLPEPVVHTTEQALENIEVVTDHNRAIRLIEQMYDESVVGWDYETNAERPYGDNAKILSVALAGKNFAFSFPIHHRENRWTSKQLAAVEECYKHFLYKAPCRKVAHHLGFEQEWSAFFYGNQSVHAGKYGCSLSQAFILDGRTDDRQFSGCLGLGFLTLQYFGINIKSIDNLDRKNLDACPLEQVLRYNGLDAKFHRMLYFAQAERLKQEGMMDVYQQHLKRVSTMVLTQIKGVPVDQDVVKNFHDDYIAKIEPIEEKIESLDIAAKFQKLKGHKFRPSAPEDIGFIVHNILNVEGRGADEDVLNKVKHPITKLVLRHRKLSKTLSTYIKPYMIGVEGSQVWLDGLLHPIYSTCRVRTWRTSSDSPNVQNVSAHNDGKEVRKQVKPGGTKRVVKFDYSGIQARNVAMESKDHALVDAFWHDYDIHSDWRDRIARRYPQWVEGGVKNLADEDTAKKYRYTSKNLFVFPSFFGAGYRKLAQYLGIPEDATKDLSDEFWGAFPGIKKWHDIVRANYTKTGYVTGLSGFRRHAPVSYTEQINSPIQSDETIIVCNAMARLSKLDDMRFQANMMIHDDLTFIWEKHEIEKNMETVLREMLSIDFGWINVPLQIEVAVGEDWASTKEVGVYKSTDLGLGPERKT